MYKKSSLTLFTAELAIVMKDIEKLSYNFSALIPEVRQESYWLRLNKLRMYSQKGANGEMPVCL